MSVHNKNGAMRELAAPPFFTLSMIYPEKDPRCEALLSD